MSASPQPQTELSSAELPEPWKRVFVVGFSQAVTPKIEQLFQMAGLSATVEVPDPDFIDMPGPVQEGDLWLLAEKVSPREKAFDWIRSQRRRLLSTPALVLTSGEPPVPPKDLVAVDALSRRGLSVHALRRSLGYLRQAQDDERWTEALVQRLQAMESYAKRDDEHAKLLELAGAYRAQMEAYEAEIQALRAVKGENGNGKAPVTLEKPAKKISPAEEAGSKAAASLLKNLEGRLDEAEQESDRVHSVLDEIRSRLGGGEDALLPDKISAMTARFMTAEWTTAVQAQQIQQLQQRAAELESQLKTLGALVEASDDVDPDGVLEQLASRLVEYEDRRREQQGTIDQLTHSLAVRQVDDSLDSKESRHNALGRLDEALVFHRGRGRVPACLWLSIDGAEDLRSRHGSVIFDYVLVQVAERLKRSLRQRDQLLRYDSDAFVLVSEVAYVGEAEIQATRLAGLISKDPVSLGPRAIPVTLSVALTLASPDQDEGKPEGRRIVDRLQTLLKKDAGRPQRRIVDPTLDVNSPVTL